MGAPYNSGQPVKIVFTDVGGVWLGNTAHAGVIYDEQETVLTLNAQDYLVFVSANGRYNTGGGEGDSAIIMSASSSFTGSTALHLLTLDSGTSFHWTAGGEGLFLPNGKSPWITSDANTVGAAAPTSVIVEARLIRNTTKQQGYPNPILQRT